MFGDAATRLYAFWGVSKLINSTLSFIIHEMVIYIWLMTQAELHVGYFFLVSDQTDNNVGCYNLKCPGFVQTSHALTLGGALRVSSYGAEQIIIAVKIFRVIL